MRIIWRALDQARIIADIINAFIFFQCVSLRLVSLQYGLVFAIFSLGLLLRIQIFLFSYTSRPVLGLTQPQLVGYQGCLPRVKWWELEIDHSNPTNALVKNEWSYISTPPLCLHGVCRDTFPSHQNLVGWEHYEQRDDGRFHVCEK